MDGRQFHEKLIQIGYPDADKLRIDTFEYLLEDEDLAPFFEFFNQIDESNILTREEVMRYEALQKSGAKLFETEELKSSKIESKETEVPIQDLRKEVSLLSEELIILEQEKTMPNSLYELLSKQMMSMNTLLDEVKMEAKEAERGYQQVLMDCQAANKEMNKVFEEAKVHLSTIELIAKMANTISPDSLYLAFTPLEKFLKTYKEYDILLKEYTHKQFNAKIIKIAELESDPNYKVIDLKVHSAEKVTDEHVKMSKLLKMHHNSFCKVELQLGMANAKANGMKKQIKAAEHLLASLLKGSFPYTTILSHKLAEYKVEEAKYKADVGNLRDNIIPKLVSSLADANASCIITGNYDLKWKRQKYVTSKMDQLVFCLTEQMSHAEFYSLCLKSELNLFKQVHQFLQFVQVTSGAQIDGYSSRKAAMEQLCASLCSLEKDEKENGALLEAIKKMLQSCSSPQGEKRVLNRIQKILSKVECLKESSVSGGLKTRENFDEETKRLDQINSSLMGLKNAVWADHPTAAGPPHLGPKEIDESLKKFEAKYKKLEFEFLAARLKLEEKEKMLKCNGELKKLKAAYLDIHSKLICE